MDTTEGHAADCEEIAAGDTVTETGSAMTMTTEDGEHGGPLKQALGGRRTTGGRSGQILDCRTKGCEEASRSGEKQGELWVF